MRNLRSYGGQNGDGVSNDCCGKKVGGRMSDASGIGKEDFEKYAGLGEDELVAELAKSVRAARASGTLDRERLEAFTRVVSPHLPPEGRERLKSLIGAIESGDI